LTWYQTVNRSRHDFRCCFHVDLIDSAADDLRRRRLPACAGRLLHAAGVLFPTAARLAALLASPATSGPSAVSPYAAVSTTSVGIYTNSPDALPPVCRSSTAPAPPSALSEDSRSLAIFPDLASAPSGGAGSASFDALAALTNAYGTRVPLSSLPAHGPLTGIGSAPGAGHPFDVGPLLGGGPVFGATPRRHTPAASTVRHGDYVTDFGTNSFVHLLLCRPLRHPFTLHTRNFASKTAGCITNLILVT
jgi:hypothetical protein